MLLVLVLWLAVGATACSDGVYPCLKADLGQAISRIARADTVRLLPGLSLDRKPGVSPELLSVPTDPSVSQLYSATERLFASHSLFWNLFPGVDLTVAADKDGQFQLGVARCHHRQERTFKFGMRRMKMILLPIMYKLGVITTLLTLLTVFALKGLTIGVLLLIMSTAGLVAKFKWTHHHGGYGPPPGKEVHVHVHGGHGSPAVYHSSPPVHYDEWVREDRPAAGGGGWEEQRPGWAAGGEGPRPGVVTHPHRVVHRVPQGVEDSPSPWASYIGDQAL